MRQLPVEIRNSFLPWEGMHKGNTFVFRVLLPDVLGEGVGGWVKLTCSDKLEGLVEGNIPGWDNTRFQSLNRAVDVIENVALARGWSELWALAREVER